MAKEIELKLRIQPGMEKDLFTTAFFNQFAIDAPTTFFVQTDYYDTPGLTLRQQKMALRLRTVQQHYWQTFKQSLSEQIGLHQREEIELPVDELAFNWQQFPEHVHRALHDIDKTTLKPIFTSVFQRTTVNVTWNHHWIEFVLDQGCVKTDKKQVPCCEIELELKRGNKTSLIECAQALLPEINFAWEPVSKAAKGYALVGYPVKPAAMLLHRNGYAENEWSLMLKENFLLLQQSLIAARLQATQHNVSLFAKNWQSFLLFLQQYAAYDRLPAIQPTGNLDDFLFHPEVNQFILQFLLDFSKAG